jgi:hypothetical protein
LNEPQPAACSGAEGGRATSSEANDIEMTSAERQQIKRSPQEWGRISVGLTNGNVELLILLVHTLISSNIKNHCKYLSGL